MLIARRDDDLVEAEPGERAVCPICGEAVIARCGDINVWHWAHRSNTDCDPWSEGETEWHARWKQRFPVACREVAMGEHRADVVVNGVVIEFQRSHISPDEIARREQFYGERMIWVVYADDCRDRIFFEARQTVDRYIAPYRFRWKHMRRTWTSAERMVILDFPAWDHHTREASLYARELFAVTEWPERIDPEEQDPEDYCVPAGYGRFWKLEWVLSGKHKIDFSEAERRRYEYNDRPRPLPAGKAPPRTGPWADTLFDIDNPDLWK